MSLPVNMALALFLNIFKNIEMIVKGVSGKSGFFLIELPIELPIDSCYSCSPSARARAKGSAKAKAKAGELRILRLVISMTRMAE